MRLVSIGLFTFLAMILSSAAADSSDLVLERVVMVSRHGIRSPTRTVAVLNALTKRGWPVWPVGPGEMTEHGARNLGFMADFLRRTYAESGLLAHQGCPPRGAVAVWADSLDRRTKQSGDIFAEHLAPGCRIGSGYADPGMLDPVFDASKTKACSFGIFATGAALANAARQDGGMLRPTDRHALETLQSIVAPEACKTGIGLCLLPGADASSARNAASLGLGATIAEGLYLEYAQGFPPADVGWGKAGNAETIAAVMPVHEHGIDLLRRTPALAGKRGVVLARTILALLQGRPMPNGAPVLPPEARLVMFAGHDSNLLYMAALMGLDWELPGQPTMTAPDTTLAFEVWHDRAADRRTVKVVVYAQSLAQLRAAEVLDARHPPDIVSILPDACGKAENGCELAPFVEKIERQLSTLCNG